MALSRGSWVAIVVLVIVVILIGTTVSKYNQLARLDVAADGAWADIENQLLRRNDLIPNYVETVKGYASHEKELFENIAASRAKLSGSASIPDKIGAANEMSGFLGRLLAIVENYPVLKANENFMKLQDELAGTENRIANSRRIYNEHVRMFNTAIRVFPTNIIAGFVGYEKKTFFEVAEEAKQVPEVNFNN